MRMRFVSFFSPNGALLAACLTRGKVLKRSEKTPVLSPPGQSTILCSFSPRKLGCDPGAKDMVLRPLNGSPMNEVVPIGTRLLLFPSRDSHAGAIQPIKLTDTF